MAEELAQEATRKPEGAADILAPLADLGDLVAPANVRPQPRKQSRRIQDTEQVIYVVEHRVVKCVSELAKYKHARNSATWANITHSALRMRLLETFPQLPEGDAH